MSACRRKADISDYDAVSARASADVSNLYLRCGRRTKKSFYYNYFFWIGGPGSCAIGTQKQKLRARCGRKCPFDAQKEFSAVPAPKHNLESALSRHAPDVFLNKVWAALPLV